ncbi:MAG: acetyl-CoA carboxylase biotin carboxyl carrier protein [Alphaproteobacteria bacterium]|nr:acetyl-CoA carboxylase biotin carboxyl carrier protein [Alphaproteobacteria bacterium]
MAEPNGDDGGEDLSLIRALAGVLEETGLTEIEIERAEVRVRVARTAAAYATYEAPPRAPAAPAAGASPTPAEPSQAPAGPPAGAVSSPMVGTVYVCPSPGAAPFVTVGQSVREGETLMIVEAMKTMNPVVAPRSGSVTSILVRNEQPVEFGETLLTIE